MVREGGGVAVMWGVAMRASNTHALRSAVAECRDDRVHVVFSPVQLHAWFLGLTPQPHHARLVTKGVAVARGGLGGRVDETRLL